MKKIMEKLNKHFFPLLVVAVLFLGFCLPIRVSAASPNKSIEYTEMDYTVTEGPLYNRVTVPLSSDFIRYELRNESTGDIGYHVGTTTYPFYANSNQRYSITIHPVTEYGLSLANIPEGSKILVDFKITCHASGDNQLSVPSSFIQRHYYTTVQNQWIVPVHDTSIPYGFGEQGVSLSYALDDIPDNAANFVPAMKISPFVNRGSSEVLFTLYVENVSLVMDISTGYWEQWLAEQNGEMIDGLGDRLEGAISDSTNQIVNGTPEQNQIANESNNEMSAAAGKLDNLGDQLNSVEKPNADSMNVSADKLLGGMAATSMLTAPVLEIWKNPVALSILTVVVTIVLISWVFFGKK